MALRAIHIQSCRLYSAAAPSARRYPRPWNDCTCAPRRKSLDAFFLGRRAAGAITGRAKAQALCDRGVGAHRGREFDVVGLPLTVIPAIQSSDALNAAVVP